jgi:hypothetical protein
MRYKNRKRGTKTGKARRNPHRSLQFHGETRRLICKILEHPSAGLTVGFRTAPAGKNLVKMPPITPQLTPELRFPECRSYWRIAVFPPLR